MASSVVDINNLPNFKSYNAIVSPSTVAEALDQSICKDVNLNQT